MGENFKKVIVFNTSFKLFCYYKRGKICHLNILYESVYHFATDKFYYVRVIELLRSEILLWEFVDNLKQEKIYQFTHSCLC